MSHAAREKALEVFKENPDCRILLAGLKVGGIGLNLTMASKVVIVDMWWNASVEQQGMRNTGVQSTYFGMLLTTSSAMSGLPYRPDV